MARDDFYRQVRLSRGGEGGTHYLTTWVEEPKAVQGARVQIKDDPEGHIWVIGEVWGRQTRAWVNDRQKAHERWRSVADV